jgi:hypothetical protein
MLVVMRFEDLPRDWAQRPVTHPDVFEGVADLIATERSRSDGATYVLLCHPNGRLLQPVRLPEGTEAPDVLRRFLTELARHEVHDVAVVLARPGPAEPTPRDREQRDAFEGACRDTGVRLHAVAVAGRDDVRTLAPDTGCAAA